MKPADLEAARTLVAERRDIHGFVAHLKNAQRKNDNTTWSKMVNALLWKIGQQGRDNLHNLLVAHVEATLKDQRVELERLGVDLTDEDKPDA